MTLTRAVAGLGLVLALAGCASTSDQPFQQGAERYRFDLELTPVRGDFAAFGCAGAVTDLSTGRQLATMRTVGRPSAAGTAIASDPGGAAKLEITVRVNPDGGATCSARLTNHGRLIASDQRTAPPRS